MSGLLVNDVHSQLNETSVDEVVPFDSLESIGAALARARAAGKQISIAGGRHAMIAFRRLIDLALERGGGSFYVTYHRWATSGQLLTAYPQLPAFLDAKLEHDPEELFRSDWYRWLRSTVELEAAA